MRTKAHQKLIRIKYDKEQDEYQLLLSTDGGETWGFDLGCKCQKGLRDGPDDEPMLISCSMLEEIKKSILCGFEMVY